MLSVKIAEATTEGGEDDPLDAVVVVVLVRVTAAGALEHVAGVDPDANKGEPKGVHHGSSFAFMAGRVQVSSQWTDRKEGRVSSVAMSRLPRVREGRALGKRLWAHRP